MSTRLLYICWVLAAAGISCTDETTSVVPDAGGAREAGADRGPGDDGRVKADQELTQVSPLVRTLCEVLVRCEEQQGATFADGPSCERHFTRRLGCGSDTRELNSGAEARCLTWLQGVTCEDAILASGCVALARPLRCSNPLLRWGERGAPGCAQVELSSVAKEGASCESLPCDEGLYCKRGPSKSVCPVCRAEAALGEACLYNPILPTHLPCAPGLYCSGDRRCEASLPVGQACEVDRHCASGFCRDKICAAPLAAGAKLEFLALDQCQGFLVGRDGACSQRRAEGEPCRYDVDCTLDGVCVQGKCQTRDVCEAREAGEPCITEPLGCKPGAFCNNTADPQLCEAIHQLGEPCEFTEDCGDDAYCSLEGQLCTAFAKAGESCTGALLCAKSLYCALDSGELCSPRLVEGASCSYSFECLSDYCDADASVCVSRPPCTMP